jgi:hypothetical protein
MIKSILSLDRNYSVVVPALFAYLFNRISLKGFIHHVGDRQEANRIKNIARVNGYILKNCKLYAYAYHCARIIGEKLPNHKDYEVTAHDAILLRRLNLKHLDHSKYRSFTLKEFDSTIEAMITSPDIKNNVGKFVSKKMKFLMDSYGVVRHDIEAFLKEQAIVAVYKQYPRYESYLHFVNVAKAQIHNKGQTFITQSTRAGRQQLIRHENGTFEAAVLSLEAVMDIAAPVQYGLEVRERLLALAKIENAFPERTKEFLLCAAGHYHDGFSAYLKCQNDMAVDTMQYEKYLTKLQKYFMVTPEKTEMLFRNIRNKIYRVNL